MNLSKSVLHINCVFGLYNFRTIIYNYTYIIIIIREWAGYLSRYSE